MIPRPKTSFGSNGDRSNAMCLLVADRLRILALAVGYRGVPSISLRSALPIPRAPECLAARSGGTFPHHPIEDDIASGGVADARVALPRSRRLVESTGQDGVWRGRTIDDPVHSARQTPSARSSATLPLVGRNPPDVVTILGVQVDL